jgi:hypothetical protein
MFSFLGMFIDIKAYKYNMISVILLRLISAILNKLRLFLNRRKANPIAPVAKIISVHGFAIST